MGVLGKCPFTGLYLMMPETLGALCAAPPGTGKTTSLAVPTLLICTENPEDGTPISIIAHDPKVEDRMTRAGRVGELALLTSGYRSKFSDCYNLNFSAQDDKAASVHYPSWNFMSPLVVPPVGGQRDNYIDRMTAIICPESTSSADPFWTRAARGALAGFIHFMISKVERANLQDRIHEILSKPDYSEDQTARIPFPPHIKAEILGLMTRVDTPARSANISSSSAASASRTANSTKSAPGTGCPAIGPRAAAPA